MIFKTRKLNFFNRFKRTILYEMLIYTPIIIFSHYMVFPASEEPLHLEILFSTMLILILFIILKHYAVIKQNFYQVEITGKDIVLFGDIWNKSILINLSIAETDISIKSKHHGYYIRLTNKSKEHDINKMFNWNYEVLIKLFQTFKEVKKEKIIWDEKYLLEYMKKKSRSKSAFDFKMD